MSSPPLAPPAPSFQFEADTPEPQPPPQLLPPENEFDPLSSEYIYGAGADKQKKQEYNANQGRFANTLRQIAQNPTGPTVATYISNLAEDERRFVNRRQARSEALGAARETLLIRQFEAMATRVLAQIPPLRAEGFAKRRSSAFTQDAVSVICSDWHVGAKLPGEEHPIAFDFDAATRACALFTNEFTNWHAGEKTRLNLCWLGDLIEGLLGHDQDDGEPLTEQLMCLLHILGRQIELAAATNREVFVYGQGGNHGRNKLRHQGRATQTRWDQFEILVYRFVEMWARELPNVKFVLNRKPWASIELPGGKRLLGLHGDGELALQSPASSAGVANNVRQFDSANATLRFGEKFDALAFGHFHFGNETPTDAGALFSNGPLVPPNGFARTMKSPAGPCGQWVFHSTERFAVGHTWYIRIHPSVYKDSQWDAVIPRFVGL